MAPAVPQTRDLPLVMEQHIVWQETGTGPSNALNLPAVYAVVSLIASSIDQLRVGTSDGAPLPSRITDPRAYGASLDLGDMIQHVVSSMLINGAGYMVAEPAESNGVLEWELEALHPGSVSATKSSGGRVRLAYSLDGQPIRVVPTAQAERTQVLEQEIARKKYNPNRPRETYLVAVPYFVTSGRPEGTSPVLECWAAMSGYMKAEEQAAYLLDGMHSGGILSTDHDLTPETAKRWQDTFVENKRFGRPMVLGGGLSYQNVNPDPEQAAWLPSRLYNAGVVASLYGVPPSQLGMTQQGGSSSMSYSNIQQDRLLFKSSALERVTQQLSDALSPLLPRGRRFIFDYSEWEAAGDAEAAPVTD